MAQERRAGVLLVHAPIDDPEPLFRGAPMGILYAATVLADNVKRGLHPGVNTSDLTLFDPGLAFAGCPEDAVTELGRILRERRPRVVGIGTTSHAFFWACRMAAEVKAWESDCVVVVGGPHEDEVGGDPAGGSLRDHADVFDFSIQGDAEFLFDRLFGVLLESGFDIGAAKKRLVASPSLVETLEGSGALVFRSITGVASLITGGRFRVGLPMRSRLPLDLDRLPWAPRWLLDDDHGFLFNVFFDRQRGLPKRTAQVMTTRGCKFSCSFCTERGAVSSRTAVSVLDELRALRSQGYEAVFFDDSTFHAYPHLGDLQLALESQREELALEFGGLTRVDSVLEAQSWLPLERLWDAGFSYFYLGLEHDDDAVLAEMRKGYGTAEVHRCLDLFAETSFRLGVSVLFGFERESEESRRRTLRLVAEHPSIVLVNLNVLAYHPAAVLLRRAGVGLRYDCSPPNLGPEWNLFEEGRWHHPPHVDSGYARSIHTLVREVDAESGGRLVPKLKRGKNLLGPRGERYLSPLTWSVGSSPRVQELRSSNELRTENSL